jgi:hypothetical protein
MTSLPENRNHDGQPIATEIPEHTSTGLIAFSAWLRQLGRSDTTGWRWAKAGWLHPINIAGRPYLTGEDIKQFRARAEAGEFSKAPAGAAGSSRRARTEKDSTAGKEL